ncbi:CAAX geranylgeranyltransferase alpha subunit [Elasticomyces elasticus]|uniref:Protein farnesyltransferase/geranylgeranyltransferase type-1 subunit alpha n=1 Tax=Exophiala sideris TaxID=1016849 RepID=A0ABR0J866_9EURO|nr:CAAX geranylgeranyltransferase alpha subunit [Elasticomyces elasticus]KAK5029574.1 CAAX geranylgeranyltransferase alpha subunit [Exophiala sideris]KAK5036733.1 CAAX geranylgeranyltransferase alpha subunit [Exophiala sideris]KAK5058203.1 CAAX geranylgeranyltransferase alpha subunit [Exophiala sideris]KAK5182163.1 CAAX geranylgeranyltransferase alpha subunit [Eurotiomycetes sp. CCFEE 6388]
MAEKVFKPSGTKPKTKSAKSREPFYAVSPEWKDVTPIPLIDGPPGQKDPGPALATIAYSPRYGEAMSYLRAVMAVNEFSRRALDLTEDIIGMNPAHYTVWLYRAKILKTVWEHEGTPIEDGVRTEFEWLDGISERTLKNYQIWHHRKLLMSLLSTMPPTEPEFLAHILSFDSKNYHVWTYRQWLCRRFPNPLLTTDMELEAIDALINEDVRNNSAWNHRYFVCFGAEELRIIESEGGNRKEILGSGKLVVDEDVVEREINYAKDHIAWAQQNPSPWNYLKGVIKRAAIPITDLQVYCESFVGGRGADLTGDQVRSSHAIDWLADIYRQDGNLERSKLCLEALGQKWDPIRRKYWDYRAMQLGLP